MHKTIVDCTKRNAKLLRELWRRGELDPALKADGTVISAMDTRIERELRSAITHVDPGAVILGEELGASERQGDQWDGRPLYLIDPIDGTHACTNGGFSFAIVTECIAPNREDVEAVIALPAYEELVRVASGEATLDNGRVLPRLVDYPSPTFAANDQLLCDSKVHRDVHVRFPGKIRSFGSTVHHAVEVARGRYVAMLWQSPYPWDTLPVLALMAAVGGSVTVLGGMELTIANVLEGRVTRSDGPLVLVAGHPSVLAKLPPCFPNR
ncbi:hypothetical protein HY480_04845 [Candidatus Uhrbacteria bacterium]|nr:hypothetical protein [Candidatus Uhrbacteria bacterium]